jgi:hypothetical protein
MLSRPNWVSCVSGVWILATSRNGVLVNIGASAGLCATRSRSEMRNRNGYHMFLLASRLSFESMHPSLDWKVSRISLSNENHSFSHIYTKPHPPHQLRSFHFLNLIPYHAFRNLDRRTLVTVKMNINFQRRRPTVLLQQVLRTQDLLFKFAGCVYWSPSTSR